MDSSSKVIAAALVGHVDAGKSTIGGSLVRLLTPQNKKTAADKETDRVADALDTDDHERVRGNTIQYATSSFRVGAATIALVDAPGHRILLKEAIAGLAGVDVAVLVVSARRGELEAGLDGGQTAEHMLLAKAAGVQAVVVAVNKLDAVAAAAAAALGHDAAEAAAEAAAEVAAEVAAAVEARYRECVAEVGKVLSRCGFNTQNDKVVRFVPVCGLPGHNLVERFPAGVCPWWTGGSLAQEVVSMEVSPRDGALCAIVTSAGAARTEGDAVVVVRGALVVGQRVAVAPTRGQGVVTKIYIAGEAADRAAAGMRAVVEFRGEKLSVNDVLTPADAPCAAASQVCALIKVTAPGQIITAGLKDLVVQIGCGEYLAEVVQYIGPLDGKAKVVRGADGKVARNPTRPGLVSADKFGGAVILRLEKEVALDLEVPALSRVVVRSGSTTIAIGRVHRPL